MTVSANDISLTFHPYNTSYHMIKETQVEEESNIQPNSCEILDIPRHNTKGHPQGNTIHHGDLNN